MISVVHIIFYILTIIKYQAQELLKLECYEVVLYDPKKRKKWSLLGYAGR